MQSEEGWEEFFDYIFPEDESVKPNLKLLEMAKAWKKKPITENVNISEVTIQNQIINWKMYLKFIRLIFVLYKNI